MYFSKLVTDIMEDQKTKLSIDGEWKEVFKRNIRGYTYFYGSTHNGEVVGGVHAPKFDDRMEDGVTDDVTRSVFM